MRRLHRNDDGRASPRSAKALQKIDQPLPALLLQGEFRSFLKRFELPQQCQAIDEKRAAGLKAAKVSAATGWRAGAARRTGVRIWLGLRPAHP